MVSFGHLGLLIQKKALALSTSSFMKSTREYASQRISVRGLWGFVSRRVTELGYVNRVAIVTIGQVFQGSQGGAVGE